MASAHKLKATYQYQSQPIMSTVQAIPPVVLPDADDIIKEERRRERERKQK